MIITTLIHDFFIVPFMLALSSQPVLLKELMKKEQRLLRLHSLVRVCVGPKQNVHCKKKIRIFYGKIPGNRLPVHFPLNYGSLLVEPFLEIKIWKVMLTDNTRNYLCRIKGLYDQNQYMSFCYRTVSGPYDVITTSCAR